jgi:hypothetical protein
MKVLMNVFYILKCGYWTEVNVRSVLVDRVLMGIGPGGVLMDRAAHAVGPWGWLSDWWKIWGPCDAYDQGRNRLLVTRMIQTSYPGIW